MFAPVSVTVPEVVFVTAPEPARTVETEPDCRLYAPAFSVPPVRAPPARVRLETFAIEAVPRPRERVATESRGRFQPGAQTVIPYLWL